MKELVTKTLEFIRKTLAFWKTGDDADSALTARINQLQIMNDSKARDLHRYKTAFLRLRVGVEEVIALGHGKGSGCGYSCATMATNALIVKR